VQSDTSSPRPDPGGDRPSPGWVYLVGAGPGDPGLLTLRGAECLALADVVLYDGLVNPQLLRHTHARAERTSRADGDTGRRLDQAEINRRLVELALAGKTVVRLKGGDPFVFGRGSEEALALEQAGIPFEVVPGITAAVAASAYAGISVTHRDHASAVAFVTGHEDPSKPESALDFAALAAFPGTLVFYMGLHRIAAISKALVSGSKSPTTPVAVICRGTWSDQRQVVGTLADIAERVRGAGLHPPSLIVVGPCVSLANDIAWLRRAKPLLGLRIGLTRAETQVEQVEARVSQLGGSSVLLPTIRIEQVEDHTALDKALDELGRHRAGDMRGGYDWVVFTSVNGVAALFERLRARGHDARTLGGSMVAAIGDGTARELARHGIRADVVPETFRAEGLAAALVPHAAGRRFLWARASRGRDVLPTALREAGGTVDEVVVYRNVDVDEWPAESCAALVRGEVDWICLSSPSIARGVARLWSGLSVPAGTRRPKLASISPVTTAAAVECGLRVDAEATVHNWEGLLDAVVRTTRAPNAKTGSPQ
jgi:uroporphyrinogen III methyltransferase / synthase